MPRADRWRAKTEGRQGGDDSGSEAYSGTVNSDPGRNRGYGPVNEVHVPMLSDARVNE